MNNVVFLPITRTWSADIVSKAIVDSDLPRNIILYFDAPNCIETWIDKFPGFNINIFSSDNDDPPFNVFDRRSRHLEMRRISQKITKDYDYVLYIEDDTIIPKNTWSTLFGYLELGYKAASGIQIGRHGSLIYGVWKKINGSWMSVNATSPMVVDAVGHYCLLTSGKTYADAIIEPFYNEPIDRAHTKNISKLIVDPSIHCGHLLENGEVLW